MKWMRHNTVSTGVLFCLLAFGQEGRATEAATELRNEFLRVAVEADGGRLVCTRSEEDRAFAEGTLFSGIRASVQPVVWPIQGVGEATATENRYGNNEYEGTDRLGYGIVHDPDITPRSRLRRRAHGADAAGQLAAGAFHPFIVRSGALEGFIQEIGYL